jgi:hypothetical protein
MPKKEKIVMTKSDFVKEHKKLTKLLDNSSKKLKKESNEQKRELKKKT